MLIQLNLNNLVRSILPSDWSDAIIEITIVVIQFAVIILLFFIAKNIIEKVFTNEFAKRIRLRKGELTNRSITITNMLKNLSMYILYFVFIYALLTALGFPVGTLIAGAGIAGVAIGLGAQDLINDMINGFFIIFENQFEVGDFVEIPSEEITGTVANVGIRTTTVTAASGDVYYIPNSIITTVNNKNRSSRQILIEIPYESDVDFNLFEQTVKEITASINESYESIMEDEPSVVGIVRGENQSFNYRIAFTVSVGEDYMHTSKFYHEYLIGLQEENLRVPSSVYDEIS